MRKGWNVGDLMEFWTQNGVTTIQVYMNKGLPALDSTGFEHGWKSVSVDQFVDLLGRQVIRCIAAPTTVSESTLIDLDVLGEPELRGADYSQWSRRVEHSERYLVRNR